MLWGLGRFELPTTVEEDYGRGQKTLKSLNLQDSQLRLLGGGNGSANGNGERKDGTTPRQRPAALAHDDSSLDSNVPF